jgi:transcriptional regulator
VYRPKAFDIADIAEIHDIIERSGPAHLVSMSDGALVTSILPMLLDRSRGEFGTLLGHLARPNEQWRDVDTSVEAVVIFTGPDAYVSPSFYPSKAETGKVVPTWNYVTIDAYGPLIVHDDREFVEMVVRGLTAKYEGRRAEPWSVDDAPAQYVEAMLGGIVGVEVPITRLEGKAKLSQNRGAADAEGVVAGLSAGTPMERDVAELMRAIIS